MLGKSESLESSMINDGARVRLATAAILFFHKTTEWDRIDHCLLVTKPHTEDSVDRQKNQQPTSTDYQVQMTLISTTIKSLFGSSQ